VFKVRVRAIADCCEANRGCLGFWQSPSRNQAMVRILPAPTSRLSRLPFDAIGQAGKALRV